MSILRSPNTPSTMIKGSLPLVNENKFACVDGPEFDAHLVDFANLVQRQQMYKGQEMLEYSCGGHCKCVEE